MIQTRRSALGRLITAATTLMSKRGAAAPASNIQAGPINHAQTQKLWDEVMDACRNLTSLNADPVKNMGILEELFAQTRNGKNTTSAMVDHVVDNVSGVLASLKILFELDKNCCVHNKLKKGPIQMVAELEKIKEELSNKKDGRCGERDKKKLKAKGIAYDDDVIDIAVDAIAVRQKQILQKHNITPEPFFNFLKALGSELEEGEGVRLKIPTTSKELASYMHEYALEKLGDIAIAYAGSLEAANERGENPVPFTEFTLLYARIIKKLESLGINFTHEEMEDITPSIGGKRLFKLHELLSVINRMAAEPSPLERMEKISKRPASTVSSNLPQQRITSPTASKPHKEVPWSDVYRWDHNMRQMREDIDTPLPPSPKR